MKNFKFLLNILFISILFSAVSCKKDDVATTIFNASQVTTGTWQVTSFHEDDQDHTADLIGYTFIFNTDGTLTAELSGIQTTGTWDFDDSGNELHLNIGTTSPLSDINKGWIILESTATSLRLGDDSSNNEELDFTKL